MAQRITVAELDINTQAFLAQAEKTKQAITLLTLEQQKLKAASKENTKEFVLNEAQLKKQKAAYTQQKNAIIAMETPYAKLSRQLIIARTKAKDLAVEFGVNDKQARKAAAGVRELDNKLKTVDKSVGQSQRNVGNYGSALKGLASSFLGVTAVIFGTIRAIKSAISTFATFEKSNATLSAILQVEKEDMVALREDAKRLGAETAKTANEVVGLQIAFARLGFSQQEIIDLTESTINGSVAMNSELSSTANLVGAMVNSFDDFSSTDAPEIMDIMALATAKSALSFDKLENGLPIVSGAANAAGIPFTKLVSLMGKLSDAGIDTSSSSTALRNIFIESAKEGLDYSEIIEKIKNSQDKLTAANDAFGKRAAVSATVLAQNIDATEELDKALNKAAGTAQRMADKELDTLTGQTILLSSAWSGFILSIEDGEGAISKFSRNTITALTGVINILTNVNTISDGFTDFFINLGRSMQLGGAMAVSVDAMIKKSQEERLRLSTELVDLIEKQAQANGTGIDREQEMATQLNKTTDQIKSYIKEIKDKAQAVIDSEKAEAQAIEDSKEKKKVLTDEEKKATEKALKLKQDKEKSDLVTFAKQKHDLEDEIEIARKETQLEKDTLKETLRLEDELIELENLAISDDLKYEQSILLYDAHLLRLKEITDAADAVKLEDDIASREKLAKVQKQYNKQEVKSAKVTADAQKGISSALQGALGKILGDGLAQRLLSIIFGAKAEIAAVNISTAAAQAKNTAQATASAPPPFNLIPISLAAAQNIKLGIGAASASTKIITSAAISAATSAFYEGGSVPYGTGGTISGSNIPTQKGGDNILATVKSGEVILNEDQQARAGGSAFFNSIGVPGFATGGVATSSTITQPIQSQTQNLDAMAEVLAQRINAIKVVAIESDITDSQNLQTEIIQGATI